MDKPLEGARIAVLAVDGLEQAEVMMPIRALRRAGADVRIVSLRPGHIRMSNIPLRGRRLPIAETVSEARPEEYGALLVPGGFANLDLLRQSENARAFVRGMEELGRPIAAIGHGPAVLVSAGLVSRRRLAAGPRIADDIRNAGGEWVDAPVVRDGRWISCRGPLDLRHFTPAMIDLFAAEAFRPVARVRQRGRWDAQATRIGALGVAAAAAVGGRTAWRAARRRRGSILRGRAATKVIRDLGFATAVGGLLFGRLARPAVGVLGEERKARELLERGGPEVWERFGLTDGRQFRELGLGSRRRLGLASGLGLAVATIAWIPDRKRLGRTRGLRTATDLLLAGAIVAGLVNVLASEILVRHAPERLPAETGTARVPEELVPAAQRRLARAGRLSRIAHVGALASAIGTTTALRAQR